LETIGGTLIIEWEKGEEEDQPIGHSGSVFVRWEAGPFRQPLSDGVTNEKWRVLRISSLSPGL